MRKPSGSLPQSKSVWILPQDFEYLCFDFATEYLTFSEPIPDYSTRSTALLESALGSCRQTFGGKLLYPTLEKQAAILFYSLIKNHPFLNGNKRIAVISLLVFLSLNGKWLSISPISLYEIAIEVSRSDSKEKENVLGELEGKLQEYVISSSQV